MIPSGGHLYKLSTSHSSRASMMLSPNRCIYRTKDDILVMTYNHNYMTTRTIRFLETITTSTPPRRRRMYRSWMSHHWKIPHPRVTWSSTPASPLFKKKKKKSDTPKRRNSPTTRNMHTCQRSQRRHPNNVNSTDKTVETRSNRYFKYEEHDELPCGVRSLTFLITYSVTYFHVR